MTRRDKRASGGLMGGRFGCRVHAVLGHFVDASSRRFQMEPEQLVERSGAFPDLVSLLYRLCYVGFSKDNGLPQLLPGGQLGSDRRGKGAPGTVRVRAPDVIAAKRLDVAALAQHIGRFFQVAAGNDYG